MNKRDTDLVSHSLPQAVLFDYGDTIMEIAGRSRRRGIEAVLAHAENLDAAVETVSGGSYESLVEELADFGRGLDFRFETLCAKHNLEYRQLDFHRLLYGRYGINFRTDEDDLEWLYWDASLELKPEDGLPGVLEAMRSRGTRMAVISNTSFRGFVLERELERQNLMQYFEFVIASSDFGVRKPDPLLYEVALKRMQLQPSSAWYAGNMTSVDCAGAVAAGMRPVWYAAPDLKAGSYDRELSKLPAESIVIRDWTDLATSLNGM